MSQVDDAVQQIRTLATGDAGDAIAKLAIAFIITDLLYEKDIVGRSIEAIANAVPDEVSVSGSVL